MGGRYFSVVNTLGYDLVMNGRLGSGMVGYGEVTQGGYQKSMDL